MEIIAFERGIRCNPPPSLSKVVQDRPKSEILIYFQSGSTPRFIETRTGFPFPSPLEGRWCCQKPAVEYVLVARKRLPLPLLLPTNVGQFSSDNIDLPSILDEEEGEGEGLQKFLRISRGAEEETEQCRYRTSG